MRGLKTRDFENTVVDAIFCVSRNTVLDCVLAMEHRLRCEGEHRVRPYKNLVILEPASVRSGRHEVVKARIYKNSVYLDHEFEDVPRRTLFAWAKRTLFAWANFKFTLSWVTIPLLENLWLERTI